MSLQAGTRLGAYEIFALIGAGGMAAPTRSIGRLPDCRLSDCTPHRFPSAAPTNPRAFDITPAGKLVAVVPTGLTSSGASSSEVRVVLNWFEELKQRVPTR